MYSVDSSSLIAAWVQDYPIDVFPGVWDKLAELGTAGRLLIGEEIRRELEAKEDGLTAWLDVVGVESVPIDTAVQLAVRAILAAHPRLVDTRRSRSGGDPFVIALGQLRGAMVVTAEQRSNNLAKPKIPDVCDAMHLDSCPLIELFRREGLVLA